VPFVYILRCADGSLYTGIAKDLTARLDQHHRGKASRYTRAHLPIALAWSCQVETWSEALQEEHRIKQLSRAEKEALVGQGGAPIG
jgi:putative endonuclease